MRKGIALLLAAIFALSGCGSTGPATGTQTETSGQTVAEQISEEDVSSESGDESGAGRSVEKIREVCTGALVEAPYELIGSQVDEKVSEIAEWAKTRI